MSKIEVLNWASKSKSLLLTLPAILLVITGCKTDPWPRDIDGQPLIISETDYRTKSVDELVTIFKTHQDHAEDVFKTEKELNSWHQAHPQANPPVIYHSEQSDSAGELIRRGPQAKAAIPAMIQGLENTNRTTRHWALQVIIAVGADSPSIVPPLVNALRVGDTGYEAAQALIGLSVNNTNVLPMVIGKLENNLDSPDAENLVRVVNGMGQEARPAVPVLIKLLEHTNSCDLVIDTLCNLGPEAASAVPALLHYYGQLTGDNHFAQRKWVIITLGRIGPGAKEAVPTLLKAMRPGAALDAAHALWRIDPQYENLALTNARREIRWWNLDAVALLGEIGPSAKTMVPLLLQSLQSPPNKASAFGVAWALWRIDPAQKAKVITVFEDIRQHEGRYPYTELPLDAVGALWQIQPERRDELRPAVLSALKDGGLRYGWAEMKTLQPALMEIAGDPRYTDLHTAAILVIRQINRARAEWWAR